MDSHWLTEIITISTPYKVLRLHLSSCYKDFLVVALISRGKEWGESVRTGENYHVGRLQNKIYYRYLDSFSLCLFVSICFLRCT